MDLKHMIDDIIIRGKERKYHEVFEHLKSQIIERIQEVLISRRIKQTGLISQNYWTHYFTYAKLGLKHVMLQNFLAFQKQHFIAIWD